MNNVTGGTGIRSNGMRWLRLARSAALTALAVLALTGRAQAQMLYTNWNHSVPIVFNGYTRSEPLTNFPALVVVGTNIWGFAYNQFLSGTNDLAFTDATGTTNLNYEIDSWNTNGQSYVWVQVGLLTNNASITAWWGQGGIGSPVCTTNGSTWSNGYVAVWHLGDGNVLSLTDSATNRMVATNYNGATASSGFVAGAGLFQSNNSQRLTTANMASLRMTGKLTLEAWIKPASWSTAGRYANTIIGADYSAGANNKGFALRAGTTTGVVSFVVGITGWPEAYDTVGVGMPVGQWSYAAGTYDQVNIKAFVNAQQRGSTAQTTAIGAPTNGVSIGAGSYSTNTLVWSRFFDGIIDEARISNVARSTNWLWSCYMTSASNSAFQSYGYAPPGIAPLDATNVQTHSACLRGNLLATGGDLNTRVFCYWGTNSSPWDFSTNLGTFAAAGLVTNNVTGLLAGTTYSYTFAASNQTGLSFAPTTNSFSTMPLSPAITNGGASNITAYGATVYGSLSSTGESATVVYVLYGTTPGVWTGTNTIGPGALGPVSNTISGLTPTTVWYYQFAASNATGWGYATTTNSFTTLAYTLPGIATVDATNIQTRSVNLRGNLLSIGGDPTTAVYSYWGTNSSAWDFSTNMGAFSATGLVTNVVAALLPGTTYSYTFASSNHAGMTGAATNSFSTSTLWPTITNVGVSNITTTAATVYGFLSNTGESAAVVCVLYGTTPGVWTGTNTVGPSVLGLVSNALSGLSINTTWYYQFAASNAAGWGYAPTTNSFATLMWGQASDRNSLFNPKRYATLADSLVVSSGGTIAIDTGDGTNRGPSMTVNGAATYRGQVVSNQSGNVWLSLFNFGSLAINNGVSCTVTGNLGLVLAATGDLTMASTLDLSGTNSSTASTTTVGGPGGPGAEGGVRTSSLSSAPPGVTRGNGGLNGQNGTGFGAGAGSSSSEAGGGGGYGGLGGNGYQTSAALGGTNYGDSAGLLVDLFGGGGGGGGGIYINGGVTNATPGGGGGGALELIANGTLTIASNATQKVNGGTAPYPGSYRSAGGGGGGGIILAANRLCVYGTVQAKGGNGNGNGGYGGGGGGGRISFYANSLTTNTTTSVSADKGVKGGTGSGAPLTNSQDGTPGTFRFFGDGQGGDLSFPFGYVTPGVATLDATNVQTRSASLRGNLLATGGDPNTSIYCYWGTNSSLWSFSTNLGAFSAAAVVTNIATGLLPGTTYAYTFAASNQAGMAFSSTNSFATPTLWPTVANAGASNMTASGAVLYGYLSNTGESAAVVYVQYGPMPGVWTGTNTSSPSVVGLVSNTLSGLTPNAVWYYQFAASNAAGWGYAPATNSFVTLPALGQAAQRNALFNPLLYPTVADKLVVTNGTIAIDTGDGTTRGPAMTVNGTTYRGQVVPDQSNNVWLALFNFGSLALSNGVSCTVTGNLGLVLSSTGDLTMASSIDLSGTSGSSAAAGLGGPGAEGGVRTNNLGSAPPGAARGNGGRDSTGGTGFGGGGYSSDVLSGGGGGYGGVGGYGFKSPTNAPGGTNYGDSVMTVLFGGSGGGAGGDGSNHGSGGGGGGALELVANGTLTVTAGATQKVNGATAWAGTSRSAGGGSGGGIILAGNYLVVAGTIQANGGNAGSGSANYNGGGGGGGRIAFYANLLTTNAATAVSVSYGAGTTNTENGTLGTFRCLGDGQGGDLSYPFGYALPSAANLAATNVQFWSASLRGNLLTTGRDTNTVVYCYWGTNSAAWDFSTNLGVCSVGVVTNAVTGLLAGTAYSFVFAASNGVGMAFAPTTNSFTTVAYSLPGAATLGATNVQTRSASLSGNLLATGSDPNTFVFCYWGTNSLSWDFSTNLGAFSAAGVVTNAVTGLLPGTSYSYTFAASNQAGRVFAPTTNSFSTLTLWPVIANVGASNITTTAATVYGSLSNTGESATVVYVLYGTTPGVWTGTNTSSQGVIGLVSNNLAGLAQNTSWYYQIAASNAAGWGYAPTTNTFTTLPALGQAAQQSSLVNPMQYATVADKLVVTNGTIAIDTGDGTTRGPAMTVNGTTYRGQVVPDQSNNVWLALFNFGSLAISNGVSCTVTGNLGLVLSSTGDFTMASTIDLSGAGGTSGAAGLGGPGAEGGIRTNSLGSAPPGAARGSGGRDGTSGTGFGAGGFSSDSPATVGAGGGYGGIGGNGVYSVNTAQGGTNYGDSVMTVLFGGSGGGAGGDSSNHGSGGGGGGALELVANGTLTVSASATQKVNGATAWAGTSRSAGGGSGGGIILAGNYLVVAGTIQANGGNGTNGSTSYYGGGGGGGRIAFYANLLTTNTTMKVSVTNGVGSASAQNGTNGTFRCFGDGQGGNLSYPFGYALPSAATLNATNVQTLSASLTGNLLTTGRDTNTVVFCYWGTNSSAWDFSANLGVCSVGAVTNVATGLLPGTTYSFVFAASNRVGMVVAPTTNSFTTLAYTLPGIAIVDATNVQTRSACLRGNLSSTGGDPNASVFCYWGTNSSAWDFSTNLGAFSTTGVVTNYASGLLPGTTYFYTFAVSNQAGMMAAPTTNSFVTATLWPTIVNVGTSNITTTAATLCGYLSNTGDSATVVYLFYGSAPGVWTGTNTIMPGVQGPVSNTFSGLPINTTWYYQFAASNTAGWGYAPTTNSFATLMWGQAAQRNSLFNPQQYATLTDYLSVSNGTITIDTGDGTNRGPSMVANGITYRGQVVSNQSGNVWLSMFNFGGLAISNGVSCTVTGNLGLVLSSTGDLTMASALDLSGTAGAANLGGVGGPGAESGVRYTSTKSAPPGGARGNGASSGTGVGCGAGSNDRNCGSGGGYGGVGGDGWIHDPNYVRGGTNYGDSVLTDLFGGSGGGGGYSSGAGGGGGALELIANGTLTIAATATQKVSGAAGQASGAYHTAGGGSGGGIILAANRLVVYGTIRADGGNASSASDTYYGGGGGGGRIAFYANLLTTNAVTTKVSAAYGTGATGVASNSYNGAPGTFRWFGDGVDSADFSFPFARELPSVATLDTTNIMTRSANLRGNLLSTGGDTNTVVTCYWGTNSSSWGFSTNMGACSVGLVTNFATGLTPATMYVYTFSASNGTGMTSAQTTNSFTTATLWPTIANDGISNLTASAATVYGYLSNTGESATVVYVFYGRAPGVWTGTNTIVPAGLGYVNSTLSGFAQNTACYYQFAASNAAGWGYAPTTNWFVTLPVLGQAAQRNSLFNPQQYVTLADRLNVTNGTIVIDTGDGTVRGPAMTVNGTTYRGQVVPNQRSNVWLSLFNFGTLAISNGVSCTVTGNLGLVLSSTGDLTMASTLDLSGAWGAAGVGGSGGPGAEGGVRKTGTNSAPPGATRGNGGCNVTSGSSGVGFGAGGTDGSDGGGGGYGGAGGAVTSTTSEGGTNYGDDALSDLLGGSGGGTGGNSDYTKYPTPSGGGGGGALEFVANGTLTVSATATQKVNGGTAYPSAYVSAGGGSGGGIVLAANRLVVSGTLQANGGNAASGSGSVNGGGGGGGRIAFYANSLTTNATMNVSVTYGAKAGSNGQNGAPGTFRWFGDAQGGDLSYPFVQDYLLPAIATLDATNIQTRSASLKGNLLSTGGDPNTGVYCYWGTNSSPWSFNTNLGAFSAANFVTNAATGLLPGATYLFTFAASNQVGMVFAPTTNSFTTPTLWATIMNSGDSNVTTSAATVYGYLSNTGESATAVYLFYGTAPGVWTGTITIGPSVVGPVSGTLSGFAPNTACYYQFAASNAAGWAYAPTTNWFATQPVLGLAARRNSLVDPNRYATVADSLVVSNGTIVIDTGDGATRGPSMSANGAMYRGQVVPNQSSNVWLSLFNFGSIAIGSNVSCTVTGNLGLVLGSTHNFTMGAKLDLSGMGSSTAAGPGGPGAEGGVRTNNLGSAPPGATRGNGGFDGNNGTGFGGGAVDTNKYVSGGGGYGGVGGVGSAATAFGGTNYGDSAGLLIDLFGGSGGGAGSLDTYSAHTSGGGGGGALELIANGTLTVSSTATQAVNGATPGALGAWRSAGGGSGGGIILAADWLVVAGTIQAKGGNGAGLGGTYGSGGGGGGGRVAFYANRLTTNASMTVSVANGLKAGSGAQDGTVGTFRYPGDGGPGDLSFPCAVRGSVFSFR